MKLEMVGREPYISHQLFLDIMAAISAAESAEDLIEIGRKFAAYEYALYLHIPAVGAQDHNIDNRIWTIGFSDEVLEYFKMKRGRPTPVIAYVLAQGRPHWLSDIQKKEEFSTGLNAHMVNLAMKNIGDSILVPLFGPFNKRGYLFVGFQNSRDFYDEVFIWQMQAIVQAVHARYCVIIESFRTRVRLTKRETEVLELISFGKTNPEIGEILGISANTVTGHVKRIFLKFDVKDRVTAALRARSFNL